MPVNIIKENEFGAYVGMRAKAKSQLKTIYISKNFDVFEKQNVRLVLAKTSRLASDDYDGIYGINFNRKLPVLEESIKYWERLPMSLNETAYSSTFAFAAKNQVDYKNKKEVYEDFYNYIFSKSIEANVIFVAQHSGDIRYIANKEKPNPKDNIDQWTAGLATLCALGDITQLNKKIICFIHASSNQIKSFPAVIDIGDFSFENNYQEIINFLNNKFMDSFSEIENKYFKKVKEVTIEKLKAIIKKNGSLNIKELQGISDNFHLKHILKALNKYFVDISDLSIDVLEKHINLLQIPEHPQIRLNHLFQGKKVCALLDLKNKKNKNLFDYSIQFECNKYCIEHNPSLFANMIVDFVNSLKGELNERI